MSKTLQRIAPHVLDMRLQSRTILDDHLERLASGGLDFSIYVRRDYGKDNETFPLTSFKVSCLTAVWRDNLHRKLLADYSRHSAPYKTSIERLELLD